MRDTFELIARHLFILCMYDKFSSRVCRKLNIANKSCCSYAHKTILWHRGDTFSLVECYAYVMPCVRPESFSVSILMLVETFLLQQVSKACWGK